MITGNRAEWDCTMLFYAILNSDCINRLNPVIQSNVDDLRKFRNEEFAHLPQGHLTDAEFQNAISKVEVAFKALSLPTVKIQAIRNQTSFPTEELRDVLKKVDNLKREVQDLKDQLNKDVSSFCILPHKPSHEVARRDCELANITEQLKELKKTNENSLSYLYISGNPGSGKSQLAALVATRFFEKAKDIPSATSFVMTVNSESPKTLLESYVSFARHLKCPETSITNTVNSNDLNEKITNLKSLIGTKIENYASWLMVVDNVTNISDVYKYWPEHGSEQWKKGQLLITTQDTESIPQISSFVQHISVSKGMDPDDARSLLSMLSGIADSEMEKEVAQALDYQPLALATAATYVKEVRQNRKNSNYGWNDFLEKLKKGKRANTESRPAETNPIYENTMADTTKLAVAKKMATDKVVKHTFILLSLCASQPLSLEILINFILEIDKEIDDKQDIIIKIRRCSLLLFEEDKDEAYIRVHQVVHDAINNEIKDLPEIQHIQAVNASIAAFAQFIADDLSVNRDTIGAIARRTQIVSHLQSLIVTIENLISKKNLTPVAQNSVSYIQRCLERFLILAKICKDDSEYYTAKKYYNLALQIIECGDAHSDIDLVDVYNGMGITHAQLGDQEEAIKCFTHALDILLEKPRAEHVGVASIYGNLGNVQLSLGNLEKAKGYYNESLKKLGPALVEVANVYHNLGNLHITLGDLKTAKEYFDILLGIFQTKPGPEGVEVGKAYNSLGVIHARQGDLMKTEEYYNLSLSIRLKMLGPEHVDVGKACTNLGNVHNDRGNLEEAKEYYNRALTIYLKKLGPEHVDVASTYCNLGKVYKNLGFVLKKQDDLEQAKKQFKCALAIRLKKLGPEHDDVINVRRNLDEVERLMESTQSVQEMLTYKK